MKAAWLHKEIYIPPITHLMSNKPLPWLDPPIQVIIQNPIQKRVDPKGATINLNKCSTLTINIYTDASSQANGTTAWACFIKERRTNHRQNPKPHPITLAELHAVKASLIWISRQPIRERLYGGTNHHPTANFNTCPEIITEIYIAASTLRQRGIQVILQWVRSHVNHEGNDRAGQLPNEATGGGALEIIENPENIPLAH